MASQVGPQDVAVSSSVMERKLSALLVRYTEDHPDVQRLRRLLERVREKEKREAQARKALRNSGNRAQAPAASLPPKQTTQKPGNTN